MHADAFAAETAEASDNGLIVAEFTVARERHEIGDQLGHIVEAMRALRVARNLRFLPRGQVFVEFFERDGGLAFQPADLVANGDRTAGLAHGAQFFDLGLQFGHRLFEIEITAHGARASVANRGAY